MNASLVFRAADRVLNYSFFAIFFLVPLIFSPFNFELFEFNKMLLTYVLTTVIVGAWIIKMILAQEKIFRRTLLDLPMLAFLLSQVASFLVSIDRHTSLFGYYTRLNGGLLSSLTYAVLYWAFVSNFDAVKVRGALKYLLSSAVIVSVWGILEHFGASPSCLILTGSFDTNCWVQDVQNRVFATLGQPNWLAAWIVALAPITWALALSKKNTEHRGQLNWLLVGVSLLLFAALLFTKSRSGFLGFMAAYTVFWGITLAKWRQFKAFLIFTFTFLILAAAAGTPWTSSLGSLIQRSSAPAPPPPPAEGGTESGEIRKIVWQGALDIWRHYPVFGTGPETFAYSYYQFRPAEHNQTSEWDFLYNKAHNEYLNFLANTGAVGLGAYLLLVGTFLWWAAKNLREQLVPAFLAGYTSILITNFFGFSVVAVATLFFLYPAMAMVVATTNNLEHRVTDGLPSKQKLAILLVVITLLYVVSAIGRFWYADFLFNRADNLVKEGTPNLAVRPLQQAITLNPGEPNYYDKLATSISLVAQGLAEENEATGAAELAKKAEEATDRAVEISPRNINFLRNRANVFYRLAAIDPSFLNLSLVTFEQVTILAPTDPKAFRDLGLAYFRAGDEEKAIEFLEKSLQLKPDYKDARLSLAEFYIYQGKEKQALEQLEYILERISPQDEEAKKRIEELKK